MDTKTKQAAIIVDYDTYAYFPEVQRWVELRENDAALVLLVTDPAFNDYDPDSPRWVNMPEFTAVIRNNGKLRDLVFKTSALCVLQDASNLLPVIAIEDDSQVQQMLRDGGVLVTIAHDSEAIYF